MSRLLITVAAVLVAAGCGTSTTDGLTTDGLTTDGLTTEPSTSPDPVVTTGGPDIQTDLHGPPAFRLSYDDTVLKLRPFTWCYEEGCVDGIPGDDLPSVGSPTEVRIVVPIDAWDVEATFVPTGQKCGRRQSVHPTRDAHDDFVLRPVGHADSYDVDLFASGDGGDMVARFHWSTPVDGELATPTARLALIADHDGRPDSYGIELMVENLDTTPDTARANITVTAANGKSLTFAATRAGGHCWPEGTVYFDGPDAQGTEAAALGPAPFTYDVVLTLDGDDYAAHATYPADEIAGNEPSVSLTFDPALPGPR